MAKRKTKRHSRPRMKISLAMIGGLLVPVTHLWSVYRATNSLEITGSRASEIMSGYNPLTKKFSVAAMAQGTLPILLGAAISRFIGGRMGVNRQLASMRLPIKL